MDIAAYKDRVFALAAKRDGEAVYNGSPDHAAIIVERIFASAERHVRLLTGDLEVKVYGDPAVVQAARRFLSKPEHKLDILVESDAFGTSHPLVDGMGKLGNLEVRRVPDDLSERVPYHFMTGDTDCFRFERDKNSHTAVAAFGDAAAATNLNGIFDSLKERCSLMEPVAG